MEGWLFGLVRFSVVWEGKGDEMLLWFFGFIVCWGVKGGGGWVVWGFVLSG